MRVRQLLGEATELDVAQVDAPEQVDEPPKEEGVAKRHLNFARMLLQMGEHEQALAEVQKALLIAPTAAAYAAQGEVLSAMGKCPDATRAFETAKRIDPRNAVAHARTSCGG